MPPVGLAIGLGMMAYGATMTGLASIAMVFGGLLQVAMSVVSMTQPGLEEPTPDAAGQMVNARDPQHSLPVIYGQQRVGVSPVYMTTEGADNKYLYLVGAICEGPIEDIAQRDGVYQIWLDDKLYTEYGSLVTYTLYTGTTTQTACAAPGFNDPLRNTAYIYLVIEYDRDKFMRVPDVTVEVKGLKVYDTRTSTTAYSTNPALCAYDFITRTSRRGGIQIDSARIITSSVNSAANYCDTKGWTCNLVLRDQESAIDMLNKILVTFRGDLIYSQCKFQLLYKDLTYESSVMTIAEQDIAEINKKSSLKIIQPSIFETPNAARVKFPNYANKHIIDDYVLVDSTAVVSDGDFREKTYTLDGVTSYAIAMKMASYLLERERINKQITFVGHSRCAALEPHDLITVTHTFPGWSSKLFRVNAVSFNPDGAVSIAAIEESTSMYDDTYDMSSHSYHDTTLPDPSATVPSVTGVSTEEVVYSYANRSFSRIKINFDPPAATSYPWWDHAEVWVSIGDTSNYRMIGTSETDFIIDPAQELTTYYIKIVSVNIWGVREEFTTAYSASHYVSGKTTAPADPLPISVICASDVVTLIAQELDFTANPDIEGYEVRIGSAWDGGYFLGVYKSSQIRIPSLRPGSYTFWLATKDNRGVYSDTKQSGTIEVFYPAGYADQNSWSWDFSSTGVFRNTETTTYDSTIALRGSHSSIVQAISNGDFTGPLTYWSTNAGSSIALTTISTGGVSDGKMLFVDGTAVSTVTGSYFYQNTTNILPGATMTFSGYYRANGTWVEGGYALYDITNAAFLINKTTIGMSVGSTVWQSFSTGITIPANCTGVQARYYFGIKDGGYHGMYYDQFSLTGVNSSILEGVWTSPEYDLGVRKKVRLWGDFRTAFVGSGQAWTAVPSSFTWTQLESSIARWYELSDISQAAQVNAILYAGDNPSSYTSTNYNFHITAPEVFARYVRVKLTITDPDMESYLYIKNLNMKAAYWTTLNTT